MKVIGKMTSFRLVRSFSSLSSLRAAREAEGLRAGVARLRAEAGGLHRGYHLPAIREPRAYTKVKRSGLSSLERLVVNSLGDAASDGFLSLLDGEGFSDAAGAFGASLLNSAEQRSSRWIDRILRGQRVR